jgi:chemotaxis protein MotB
LESDLKESERVAARLKTVILTMEEGGSERKKAIDDLNRQIERGRREANDQVKRLESQLSQAGEQDRRKAEDLATALMQAKSELTNEQQRSLELSRQVRQAQELSKSVDGFKVEIAALRAERDQAVKEREVLKKVVDETKVQLTDAAAKDQQMRDASAALDQAKIEIIAARKSRADAESALVREQTKRAAAEERAVELEKAAASRQEEKSTYELRITDLTQSLSVAQSREKDASGALENLKTDYAQIMKENRRLAEEKKAIDASVQALRSSFAGDVASERRRADGLASDIKKKESERVAALSEKDAAVAKVSALQDAVRAADANTAAKTDALNKVIASLRDDAFKKDQVVSQLTQRAQAAETAQAAAVAQADALKASVAQAQKALTDEKTARVGVQQALTQAVSAQDAAKAAFEKERDDYALLLSDREAELERLKKADLDVTRSREENAKQIATFKRESDEKDLLLADLDKQVTDLSARLKTAETQYAAESAAAKNEIAALTKERDTLLADMTALTKKVAELESAVAAAMDERDAAKNAVVQKESARAALATQAAEAAQLKARAEMDAKRASDAELALAAANAERFSGETASREREVLIADMRAKFGAFTEKYKAERTAMSAVIAQKDDELSRLRQETAQKEAASSSAQRAVIEEKTTEILALSRTRDAFAAEVAQLKKRVADDEQEKQELARLLSDAKRQIKENIQKLSPDTPKKRDGASE